MFVKSLKIACVLLFCGALLAQVGCACKSGPACVTPAVAKVVEPPPRDICDIGQGELTALPPNARPGECYAKVYVPATFKTVSERVLVRDASETIEVIPAKYEWVEERVMVKPESRELVPYPAEFAMREQTIQVSPGHTEWEINEDPNCVNPKKEPARDVFCLVTHPPEMQTVQSQVQVKPAGVKEICTPAQYDTVRKQKLVTPATTRKVCTPAEYSTVEKTVKVCDARMAWKRVICDRPDAERVTVNEKGATRMTLTADASSSHRP